MATQPEQTDWIEWSGGEPPITESTIVDVRFRETPYEEGCEELGTEAGEFVWYHTGSGGDIIAYRVASQS